MSTGSPRHRRVVWARTAAAVGAAVGLALASSGAAQAAPGDTAVICNFSMTPAGWVDISWYYSAACGPYNPGFTNTHKIKQIAGYSVGTTVTGVCGSSYAPAGWMDTSWYHLAACGPYNPGFSNAHNIKRVS